MIKANKRLLWVTSLLILLPIAAGLALWPALPGQIAIHFGVNNEPDGWSGKPFAVVGLPCMGKHGTLTARCSRSSCGSAPPSPYPSAQ